MTCSFNLTTYHPLASHILRNLTLKSFVIFLSNQCFLMFVTHSTSPNNFLHSLLQPRWHGGYRLLFSHSKRKVKIYAFQIKLERSHQIYFSSPLPNFLYRDYTVPVYRAAFAYTVESGDWHRRTPPKKGNVSSMRSHLLAFSWGLYFASLCVGGCRYSSFKGLEFVFILGILCDGMVFVARLYGLRTIGYINLVRQIILNIFF